MRAETARTIAWITAETDAWVAGQTARAKQAMVEQAAARKELERLRAQAAEEVPAAWAAAKDEADRDRRLDERAQAARAEIEQARTGITETASQHVAGAKTHAAAAEQAAETAQREAAEVSIMQTRAEADTATAERRVGDDRTTVEQ